MNRYVAMHRYLVIVIGLVILFSTHSADAQTSNLDSLLSRIDYLILEMGKVKKEVEALRFGSPVPQVEGVSVHKVLTQSLEYGVTNDDIAKIQKLLATDPEIYPYGVVSGFFGPKTEEAIKNLQTRHGLDPVGVVGLATQALLEGYFAMYPSEAYPADVLKKKPQVLGVSARTQIPSPLSSQSNSSSGNPLKSVTVKADHGEAKVSVVYINGTTKNIVADGYTNSELVSSISKILKVSVAYVKEIVTFKGGSDDDGEDEEDDEDNEYDKGDAEDAIEDADQAIEDAEDAIDEAVADGDDVDDAEELLDEAADLVDDAEDALDDRDYDRAVSKAKKAKKLAEEAEDEAGGSGGGNSKGNSDEIESITAKVKKGQTKVTVEYEDDDSSFTVKEDKVDEIIEEVADELNINEDEAEDLIEFDFGDIDSILVIVKDGKVRVEVEYETGVTRRIMLTEKSESKMIRDIARELDIDEDDVEDVAEFEYDN